MAAVPDWLGSWWSWRAVVDIATIVALGIALRQLRSTKRAATDAKDASNKAREAAEDAASKVAGRSAELQLQVLVRELQHHQADLQQARTTNNTDAAAIGLRHWQSDMQEAIQASAAIDRGARGNAEISRGTTAARNAMSSVGVDGASVDDVLRDAIVPMQQAIDAVHSRSASIRYQAQAPEVSTP